MAIIYSFTLNEWLAVGHNIPCKRRVLRIYLGNYTNLMHKIFVLQ